MDELIPEALDGERLDRVVALLADVSRSIAAAAITQGNVTVDGDEITRSTRVASGQRLWIDESVGAAPPPMAGDPTVDVATLAIDDDVIVVDKAAGQIVHPGSGHERGTIVQGLLARFPEIADVGDRSRPGVVHRLDRGTTGVFVVARTERAFASLTDQIRHRSVGRRYVALVWGLPESVRGIVDAPIGRALRQPTRMTVRADGRAARTSYEVEAAWGTPGVTLVSCVLETGRTHQIRVHMAAIGHPVVGDTTYGRLRPSIDFGRPALHAARLEFDHPGSGRRVEYSSPLPRDLVDLLERLGPPTRGALPTWIS